MSADVISPRTLTLDSQGNEANNKYAIQNVTNDDIVKNDVTDDDINKNDVTDDEIVKMTSLMTTSSK